MQLKFALFIGGFSNWAANYQLKPQWGESTGSVILKSRNSEVQPKDYDQDTSKN
jgi:hypothetical protein